MATWEATEFGGFKAPNTYVLRTSRLTIRLSKVDITNSKSYYLTCAQLGIFLEEVGDLTAEEAQTKALASILERVQKDLEELKGI